MGRVEHNRLVLCSKEEPYSELTAGTIVELAHTRDSIKEWRAPLHGDRADSWLMAVLHHDAFCDIHRKSFSRVYVPTAKEQIHLPVHRKKGQYSGML